MKKMKGEGKKEASAVSVEYSDSILARMGYLLVSNGVVVFASQKLGDVARFQASHGSGVLCTVVLDHS